MSRRDIGTDDPRVHVRPGKGSRPRTKIRPDYSGKPLGQVIAINRGRYTVLMEDSGTPVQTVRAKELGRGAVVMGDCVRVSGDVSGRPDTLARIVQVNPRSTVLRRSLEDAPDHLGEKVIVANAQVMLIVVALADPPPRLGMVDRCLVAAYQAGLTPVLCLTKADLASPDEVSRHYLDFGLTVITTAAETDQGLDQIRALLHDHFGVMVGHSGVGKSTLINALVPDAHRATGHVNAVTGRGRHTSTSSEAFELPSGGWLIDTPGVRSFGIGHVEASDVLGVYPDIAHAATFCLPLCTHGATEPSCALDAWALGLDPFPRLTSDQSERNQAHVRSVRRLLDAVATAQATSRAAR